MLNAQEGPSLTDALNPLTRDPVIASLKSLVGEVEARRIWRDICRDVDADPNSENLDFETLERIAERLTDKGGALSLVGSSLAIRIHTYRMLSSAQRLEAFLGGKQ